MRRDYAVRPYRPVYTQVTFAAAVRSMAGQAHMHCCYECKGVYTCACETPEVNVHCVGCRSPFGRPLWDRDRDPVACCRYQNSCEMVTDGRTIVLYRLAGPGPWFLCQTCHRAHGYLPKENEHG